MVEVAVGFKYQQMGTSDVLSSFNRPLRSRPVLDRAQTGPARDVSGREAFCCPSVDKHSAWRFCLSFLKKFSRYRAVCLGLLFF